MKTLDPLLSRQLRKLGLEGLDRAPTLEEFVSLVDRISEQYGRAAEDRQMTNRSLELSTEEMNQLRERVESERDRLQQVLGAIAEAIAGMGDARPDDETARATSVLTELKRSFSERIRGIFAQSDAQGSDESSRVRVIESGFVRLADQLETLLHEMSASASMKKELEVARTVQQLLLPPEESFVRGSVEFAAYCRPAQECGGDWWSTLELAEGRLLAIVGDVTGHGVASAILTGTAKAAVDLVHLATRGKLTPHNLLHLMNHAVYLAGKEQVMMTASAAVIDPRALTLTIANAGHVFPYVVSPSGVRTVVSHGPPLGSAPRIDFEPTTVQLAKGDTIVWYTDGVTERENEAGEAFSERRLRAVCQRCATHEPSAFRDELVQSLLTFAGTAPAADDVTLVLARIN